MICKKGFEFSFVQALHLQANETSSKSVEHDRGTANGECQWNRAAPLHVPRSSGAAVEPGP